MCACCVCVCVCDGVCVSKLVQSLRLWAYDPRVGGSIPGYLGLALLSVDTLRKPCTCRDLALAENLRIQLVRSRWDFGYQNHTAIRPCFVDSLFPVTHPHPLQATASKIIFEFTCYESP